MHFSKPPFSHQEQLDLLIERGMSCPVRERALHYLTHLNYYRLGAYWLPFEVDHATHQFADGTTFDAVLDLYLFDRELRLLVMDAIERIEVSVRSTWAYQLAQKYGSHAHLNAALFQSTKGRIWDYNRQCDDLSKTVRNSSETFIVHLRSAYDEALPPIWAVVEIMSFGQLSRWVANLRQRQDRNAIAHCYDMDEGNLCSFLHHLVVVRNHCAHHSRLWNREYTFTFKLPKNRPASVVVSLNPQEPRRIYNTLVMLAWLMDVVNPNHHWKLRLKRLIEKYQIDTRQMGFPVDFGERPLWVNVWKETP